METDLLDAIVAHMRANASLLPMLGTSAALHVESGDVADQQIVRGGIGKCLVHSAEDAQPVARSLGSSVQAVYRFALEFEANGAGGNTLVTRANIRRAVVALFGDNGDALLAELGAQADRLGMSGTAAIEGVDVSSSGDLRNPRIVAMIAVTIWQNVNA